MQIALATRPGRGSIPFIDVARSIAPLIVLWAHLGPDHGFGAVANNFITNTLHLTQGGAHVGVLLFFLVSGFIISHVALVETRLEFGLKRFYRIVPMLVIGVTIAFGVSALLRSLGLPPVGTARSISELILSAALLDWVFSTPYALSVTWTLVAEVSFYLLVFFSLRHLVPFPILSTLTLIGIAGLIELVLALQFNQMQATFYFLQVEFVLVGRAAYLFYSGQASFCRSLAVGACALAALSLLYTLTPYSRSLLLSADSVVFSWVAALAIFVGLAALVKTCPTPLRFLSNISYSVYLLHLSIGTLTISPLQARGYGSAVAFYVSLIAVLACSYLTYSLIELPFQKLGRTLLAGVESRLAPPEQDEQALPSVQT